MPTAAQNMRHSAQSDSSDLFLLGRACPGILGMGRFTMTTGRSVGSNQMVPRQDLPSVASTATHRSIAWVLEMFTAGHMSLSIQQGQPQPVERGWGALYSPDTQYVEQVEPGGQCQSVVIYFDPRPGQVLKRLTKLAPGYRYLHDPQGKLLELVQRVETTLLGQAADQLAAMGYFLQAMSQLVACSDDGRTFLVAQGKPSARDELVGQARRYMREHLHENITIAQLAKHACMSESGFAHAFRRQAGCSPMQELRRIRLEVVKAQLLHNRLTLEQIAWMTGFSDGFHLSHTFRKAIGVSPRQFKRHAHNPSRVLL